MSSQAALQVNAWLPGGKHDGARAEVSPHLDDWTIRERGALRAQKTLWAGEPADLTSWADAGWGVVLADNPALSDRERAEATDAPAAIRQLLDHRAGSPVLRYRPEFGSAYIMLCERGREARKVRTAGGEQGPDTRQVPHYLLIVGSPTQVPWQVQYVLNTTNFVGRLDLDDAGLSRYVDALIDDWSGCRASRRTAVTWAVDWGDSDITWLMRHGLAEKLANLYRNDSDVNASVHLARDQATHAELVAALLATPLSTRSTSEPGFATRS